VMYISDSIGYSLKVMTAGSRQRGEGWMKIGQLRNQGPKNRKATACRGFHDSNSLRLCVARIRDEASGVPRGAASGDVEVRIGCGSCAKEYDKESAGVNHEFASEGYFCPSREFMRLADYEMSG
jgi:hypothetical protein